MIQTAEAASLPVPPEVFAFAAQQGVGAYLPGVLGLARKVFPNAPLAVCLEGDPEIANDWHIVVEADVTGLSVAQMVAGQNQWSTELFDYCPALKSHLFRVVAI